MGDRPTRRKRALVWLFVVHLLADAVIAVYRCQDLAPWWTDLGAAVLLRGQTCLLLAWLAAGPEPWTWRVCGLIGSVAYLGWIYTHFLFPGFFIPCGRLTWTGFEWLHYFRPSGPGDWLLRLPVMALVLVPTLTIRRLLLRWRRPGTGAAEPDSPRDAPLRWWLGQFRLQDVLVWMLTLSFVLGAATATAPYPNWWHELADLLQRGWLLSSRAAASAAIGASFTACVALATFAALARRKERFSRLLLVLAFVALAGIPIDLQPRADDRPPWNRPLWRDAPHETLPALGVVALLVGTWRLLELYDDPTTAPVPPVIRALPRVLGNSATFSKSRE